MEIGYVWKSRAKAKDRKKKEKKHARRLKRGIKCENKKELDNHCGSPAKVSVLIEKASRRESKDFCCCCMSPALKETGIKLGVGDFGVLTRYA